MNFYPTAACTDHEKTALQRPDKLSYIFGLFRDKPSRQLDERLLKERRISSIDPVTSAGRSKGQYRDIGSEAWNRSRGMSRMT